jgi:uncharacterized protein (DUF983 family)
MLRRALLLRCPRCGSGRLFVRPFRMERTCRACALCFEREHGYFVGAIYVNYALTIAVAFASFLALESWTDVPFRPRLMLATVLAALLPILLHHHARSLWLGFDHLIHPESGPALRRVR